MLVRLRLEGPPLQVVERSNWATVMNRLKKIQSDEIALDVDSFVTSNL